MSNNGFEYIFNDLFGDIRYNKDDEGNIWFVAKDVAIALKYKKTQKVTSIVKDKNKGYQSWVTLGGKQELVMINEPGLYQVIFSITKKDKARYELAESFQDWVFNDVLPIIRKDGIYIQGEENMEYEEAKVAKEKYWEKKILRKWGIDVRNDFTLSLKDALNLTNDDGYIYAEYTNLIYVTIFDMTASKLREVFCVPPNGKTRDYLPSKMLDAVAQAEKVVITLIQTDIVSPQEIQARLSSWWTKYKIKYKIEQD